MRPSSSHHPAVSVTTAVVADDQRSRHQSAWFDSLSIATAAFLLVWSLRQSKFHGLDAQYYIGLVRDHSSEFYVHRLYVPLMHGWHAMLEPFGLSPFESLRLASAVGVGAGALWLHRACIRLGFDRVGAALLTCLAATAPAVVFFGTVVEIHGVFFGFAALAVWQWAHAVVAGTWPRFAVLGACTALAAAVHTSGHLLLWQLPVLTWGLRGRRWPTLPGPWRSWLVTACAHAGTTLVCAIIFPVRLAVCRTGDSPLCGLTCHGHP